MPVKVITETTTMYASVTPDGRIWNTGPDLKTVVAFNKFWIGPGKLRFERLTSVVHRETTKREPIDTGTVKSLVLNHTPKG